MDTANPALEAPAAAPAAPPGGASPRDLARAVAELADRARPFARTAPRDKAALLRATLPHLLQAAPAQAAAVCGARGIDPAGATAAEAWLAGVAPVLAYARLLADALDDIASSGRPSLPATALHKRPEGRVVARLTARTWAERAAERGRETTVLFAEGTQPEDVIAAQAPFYRRSEPEGGVALVLAGPSDATLGMMDALFALFVEGKTAVLVPGAPALAAVAERALAPLVERGFLRVAPAGPDGEPAPAPPGVGTVLRPPPPGAGALLLVPSLYARDELAYLARSVASQVAHGAALSAAAPRLLVLPAGWLQRDLFLELLEQAFAAIPTRRPYLPGAAARHAELTGARAGAIRVGDTSDPERLPWTIVPRLDGSDLDEPLLTTDPGSSVIAAVAVASDDPLDFLREGVAFCNERLGPLRSVQLTVHPLHEEDPEVGAALERAVIGLRCGAVGVNQWPALLAWAAAAPWGGAGLGFRNNARMLAGVDKAILHGPLLGLRRPGYFADNADALRIGAATAAFQAAPALGGLRDLAGR
jgi:hypothetical protein